MKIHYYLSEACQNRFVFVDRAHEASLSIQQLEQIHDYLLQSNADDAIILINAENACTSIYRVEMVVLGRDGKLGAFCGNGARVCAAYVFKYYPNFKRMFIKDAHLNYELFKYSNEEYAVQFPHINFTPTIYFQGRHLHQEGGYFKYLFKNKTFYYADAKEPHLILQDNLSDQVLDTLAKEINQDIDSFPLGINVTSYYVESDHYLHAKTYERGAQRITQSCGTGATCTAALYLKGREGRVTVVNPGGILKIKHHHSLYELKGPAFLSQSSFF
jgi:diaminopimelate epimerase